MNIVLEGKYRIRTYDKRNLVLEIKRDAVDKHKKKTGKKKWYKDGYFQKFEQLANHLLQARLKDETIESLEEMKECLNGVVDVLSNGLYTITDTKRREMRKGFVDPVKKEEDK